MRAHQRQAWQSPPMLHTSSLRGFPSGSRGNLNTRLASPTHLQTQMVCKRDWLRQHIYKPKWFVNEIGFANAFSNSKGWRTRLASPTHSPTQRVGERVCFVASLLAMTIKPAVIARLPFGKPWQSRFANLWFANRVGESKSLFNGMYYNPSPKNTRLPRLNALAFRLASISIGF